MIPLLNLKCSCCIPGVAFGLSIQLKNKKYLSGHCLLPFSYSEKKLLFLKDGIAIRFHVCSYFIYVCLDDKVYLVISGKTFWKSCSNFCEA